VTRVPSNWRIGSHVTFDSKFLEESRKWQFLKKSLMFTFFFTLSTQITYVEVQKSLRKLLVWSFQRYDLHFFFTLVLVVLWQVFLCLSDWLNSKSQLNMHGWLFDTH